MFQHVLTLNTVTRVQLASAPDDIISTTALSDRLRQTLPHTLPLIATN